MNFLPDLTGLYFGYLSPAWLIACLALLGLLCGQGERWLLRSLTSARLVLLASAVVAATDFQVGLPGMLADLRTGVITALAVKAVSSLDVLCSARPHEVDCASRKRRADGSILTESHRSR